MGRGLSGLQRYILRETARRERLHPADILAGFFGWPTLGPLRPEGERCRGLNFDREEVGPERYNASMASLSRAIRRLEDRGLIERSEYVFGRAFCLRITDKGKQAIG
jgi:hypothetical protein